MILGNAELFDAMLKTAVGVLVLCAWTYVVLEQRDLRRQQQTTRRRLHDHHRALVHLQGLTATQAVSTGQPMATIRKRPVEPADTRLAMGTAGTPWETQEGANGGGKQALHATGDTVRLHRPPALTDIEHVLTQAGRALTATEMATQLGRKPWDLLPDIDRAMAAGRIRTVPGHTAGRTAYALADTATVRMPHGMPLLPGAVSR